MRKLPIAFAFVAGLATAYAFDVVGHHENLRAGATFLGFGLALLYCAGSFEMLTQIELEAIRRLLCSSWKDIDFEYDGLTAAEREAVDGRTFERLATWARRRGINALFP